MTNQKQTNTLKNLKTIHDLQFSGEIVSFLREIQNNIKKANTLSNELTTHLKEVQLEQSKKQEEILKQEAEQKQKALAEKKAKIDEKQKEVDRQLFQEQIKSLGKKKTEDRPFVRQNNNTNNSFEKRNNQSFDQKRTFNKPQNSFNNNNRPNNNFGNRPFNSNNNFGNRPFNNNNNLGNRPYTPNNNFGNRPFVPNNANNNRPYTPNNNFNNRPFNANNTFQRGPKPFGQKPNFSTTKANNFKKFAPTPTEPMIVQQERNFGNKNKSNFHQNDEKKSFNRKMQQRRGYINLDFDNEERVTVRKLVKAKKKQETFIAPNITSAIITTEIISVKALSEKIGKPAGEIIKKLMLLGIMATINSAIDFNTAELVASELGIKLEQKLEQTFEEKLDVASKNNQDEDGVKRPPVITVMGHVDHGKTSLLDAIRQTNVASGEAGGITQKIGAYSINYQNEKLTFIDTPGHAAFTAMRARGAKITDIAILVVAADDGIMPQTIEAINHIKAAKVPMIVAINKMDKPEANIERVKSGLAENGVLPEEWGGDAILVPLSAKTGVGIPELIESILLVAEISDLKANPNKMATGTVIEAELDKNRGPIATILVQSGTLKVGDSIMSGLTFGKVRAMFNENGKQVKTAEPSTPVSILGFDEVPNSGEQVFAVDEKLSKNVIAERKNKLKEEQANKTSGVSLDDFMNKVNEGKLKNLNIIIKADVQGSVEALKQTLTAINNEEVKVNCIHSAVGNVTESDLVLAEASKAIIVNFNIKVLPKIKTLADKMKVEIKDYKVIYDVVDDLTDAINGMMTVKYEQVTVGHAEIRMIFKLSSYGLIAGSYVQDGKIIRGAMGRLIRKGEVISDTEISALKIVKDDKAEVTAGFECGIKLKEITTLQEGDIIECYQNIPIKR